MVATDAERTEAIRRRVEREYVVFTAPTVLDAEAAAGLVERLFAHADDCDVVIDLRVVESCDEDGLEVIDRASEELVRVGAKVTLSHPSPACEELLSEHPPSAAVAVRRARTARPIRRSARGQV